MSTNKSCTLYKKIKEESYDITKFLLPPHTHSKYVVSKKTFEAFSRALKVQLVKDTTISSSKAPKSHVKIVTHMHYDNGFKPHIAVLFYISPKLGGLGRKAQDLVIPFLLHQGGRVSQGLELWVQVLLV